MDVQHEPLLPVDPLARLRDDYGEAVLHLAWNRRSPCNTGTLLFAFVELLPHEIPAPEDKYDFRSKEFSRSLGCRSAHHIYLRHAVMPASDALAWYVDCLGGIVKLPLDEHTAGETLEHSLLDQDPLWPVLYTHGNEDEWGVLPFCPEWIVSPRTHHLLPRENIDLSELWSEKELERARSWLEDRLHVDLGSYPEYWGSVHLVAPNPIFRALRTRLVHDASEKESVLVHVQARAGHKVDGLRLDLHERMPWGTTGSQQCVMKSPLVSVDFGREVGNIAVDVFDRERGYVHVEAQAAPFVKSFRLDMSIVIPVVVGTGEDAYKVDKSGPPETTSVGGDGSSSARSRTLFSAYVARKARMLGREYGQRWFRDQEGEAKQVVRRIIQTAKNEAVVIDPYLGAAEVRDFALATSRYDIPVRLLTSAEYLRKPGQSPGSPTNGQALLDVIGQLAPQPYANPIEVRVMTGSQPDVHDRFLVIDGKIWLLGSSLNEFGSRGTLMVAVPDPASILGDLLQAWNDATPLHTWIAERPQTTPTPP